ncbi:hypothetical protein CJ030_MR8G002341 [Morella rubra]|uniref:K Homology domain-containing protein n=1 Tax=Morella rubra TaxID=262757 RepID=A0A6A1UNL0_9ROSI|nr:hypothetical protein CJ030_MR8G002341 [Morella rubra]
MEHPSPCPAVSDQYNVAVFSTQERKGFSKRDRPKRLAIKLLPGQVAFRFLIHVSAAARLLGDNGAVVLCIRQETATRIHCEVAAPGSDHRVFIIIGSGSREGRRVSCSQEAMLKVFERVWELTATEGEGEEVWWKMLAHTSQVGAVMGKGGKNIRRVRNESGAQIRVLPAPHWTGKDDELIQITGGVLAVKKALVDVSHCLQDCPQLDKASTPLTRPLEVSPYRASAEPHAEPFPNFSSLLSPPSPENSGISASTGDLSLSSSWNHGDGVVAGQDKQGTQQKEVVFRMLCSDHAAGWVIGKRGSIVRALQNEAGASIMFASPSTESGERVVTISAWENLESSYSAAQNAVVLVFTRMIEGVIERGFPAGFSEGRPVTAKLLVASNLVGCLVGNDHKVLSEMREVTGAEIQILEAELILNCASVNDAVLQITGEYKSVQNALFRVTGTLRDNQVRAKYPGVTVSEDPLRNDPVPHDMDACPSPLRFQLPQITGGILDVKKPLIDVSTCLQDCSLLDGSPAPVTRPLGDSSYRAFPDPELLPHLCSPLSLLAGNSGTNALNGNMSSSLIHADGAVSCQDKKGSQQEVVFRMLCSNHAAGCVIGKRGSIVRALQNETGASISFAAPLTEAGERVVTISAWENLESLHSPAQNALVLVFARIIEGVIEKGFVSGSSEGRPVTAKLLVASDVVGCLHGTDGKIKGEYKSVQNAMFQVTDRLRDNLLPKEMFKEVKAQFPYVGVSEDPWRNDHIPHKTGGKGKTAPISDTERALTAFSGGLGLGSANKIATVTNTTLEIVISQHAFGSVYGEDGGNLDRIIQISGAKVEVHDPLPGERGGRVIISGTPDKTRAAQSLLQAFIQSGGKTPYR